MASGELRALADMVLPALLLAARQRGIPAIAVGLLIELLVLHYVFPMSWKRATLLDLVMNAASGLAGALILPAAGFLWEFFPGSLYMKALHVGTFNPITWTATCVMAVFISSGIEVAVVRYAFKFDITKRRFWCIALANLLSTAVAFVSLLVRPPQF